MNSKLPHHEVSPAEPPGIGECLPGERSGPQALDPGPASIDRPLVDRSLAGDLAAFEALIARYQKAVFHVALYKSRNYFDAEDLTQDIFLAAYRALATLKDRNNFGGWLFGIAHNRSNKWYQRQRSKIIKFQEIQKERGKDLLARPPDAPEGPPLADLLTESIQELPVEVRQVLVLKYLEGKSYQTIEERMGINTHRIDYLIRKGKALLRKKLGPRALGGEGATGS